MRGNVIQTDQDEYWNCRLDIGPLEMEKKTSRVLLKIHTSEEQCYDTSHEIVPVEQSKTRTYVAARPYVLEPKYTFQVRLYPEPEGDAIGEVVDSNVVDFQEIQIGNAQSWYYHEDDTLILWECYLHGNWRTGNPKDDTMLNFLWDGFEQFLSEKFNPSHIYTPSWEPIYEQEDWEAFLSSRGYERFNERSFRKER